MKPKRIKNFRLLKDIRKLPCLACDRSGPCDASHIRSKGSGGPDEDFNVVPHCRDCHIVWHRVGWKRFLERNPIFALRLFNRGWFLDPLLGLWHPKLNKE